MSITFTAPLPEAAAYVITCYCDEATQKAKRYRTYQAACDALAGIRGGNEHRRSDIRKPLPGCKNSLCADYPLNVRGLYLDEVPAMNVSNINAIEILGALGLVDEWGVREAGEVSADDMLGRVLVALGVAPKDEGRPANILPGKGMQVIDCGREPGYLQNRLRELRTLAEWCRERHLPVTWS